MKETGGALPEINDSAASVSAPQGRGKLSEAVDALVVLGYSRAEAMSVLKDVDTATLELEEIIRVSLKKLMKF